MADGDNNEEDNFDSDSADAEGSGLSQDRARVLAMQYARGNTWFYGSAYDSGDLVWEVLSQDEFEDYYEIRLSYRPAGRFRGKPGVEQLTVSKTGDIELRQILDEPKAAEKNHQ